MTETKIRRRNTGEIMQQLRQKALVDDIADDWVLRLDDHGNVENGNNKAHKRNNKKLRPCVVCVARRTVSESSTSLPPALPQLGSCSAPAVCSFMMNGPCFESKPSCSSTIILDLDSKTRRVLGCEFRDYLEKTFNSSDFVGKSIDELCQKSEKMVIRTLLESATQCSAEICLAVNGSTIRTNAKAIPCSRDNESGMIRLECLVIGITSAAQTHQAASAPPISGDVPTITNGLKSDSFEQETATCLPTSALIQVSDALPEVCDKLFLEEEVQHSDVNNTQPGHHSSSQLPSHPSISSMSSQQTSLIRQPKNYNSSSGLGNASRSTIDLITSIEPCLSRSPTYLNHSYNQLSKSSDDGYKSDTMLKPLIRSNSTVQSSTSKTNGSDTAGKESLIPINSVCAPLAFQKSLSISILPFSDSQNDANPVDPLQTNTQFLRPIAEQDRSEKRLLGAFPNSTIMHLEEPAKTDKMSKKRSRASSPAQSFSPAAVVISPLMAYNQQGGSAAAAPLGGKMLQQQGQQQYGGAPGGMPPTQQQWNNSQEQFQQQQFYHHHPQAAAAQRGQINQHLPMMYSSQPSHPMPILNGQQTGQPALAALPAVGIQPINPMANKKSVLKRKNMTNNQNVVGISNDVRPKKQTYGIVQQNSGQVPNNGIIHPYQKQQQQQQPSNAQMYQNGTSMQQQNTVHSPQFPSPSTPMNNQHLSPYGSFDQQHLQQQSTTTGSVAGNNQLHQSSSTLGQWNKRPNSRSDINQMVRMELRNTVHSRMSDGSEESHFPSSQMQIVNGVPPKMEGILSPPRQNTCIAPFPTATPPLQSSLGFNENNNNNSAYCGNNNPQQQQLYSSVQAQQPVQHFQRACSMSNVNVQPQFFSQVSLEDCKNFIKSVDVGVNDLSSTTIELFDFNLSKTGFDMDNDETRLLVQKMLQ